MACVVLIMWRSNNVVLATGTGMAVLPGLARISLPPVER
jgi:hypothetical protein